MFLFLQNNPKHGFFLLFCLFNGELTTLLQRSKSLFSIYGSKFAVFHIFDGVSSLRALFYFTLPTLLYSFVISIAVHFVNMYSCSYHVADCEWKAQAGNVCVASFDWSCSGICKSVEKIKSVHERCGEGDAAVWSALV